MLDANAINPLASRAHAVRFLARHWQRTPAVIRGAVHEPGEGLDRQMLFTLAGLDDVESRLIRRRGRHWRLDHGPHDSDTLPAPGKRQWTLLVQSVDHHLDSAANLLHRFNFVPSVRLDDLMVSIAGDGGGVGPHDDSYDVFLLQVSGRRRWTLGRPGAHALVSDQPLRLVAHFKPLATVDLDAGDMLYVPPGWVHDGVAIGECITASIGFRAPTRNELLAAWLVDCADSVAADENPTRVRDHIDTAGVAAWSRAPGRMPAALLDTMQGWLQDWQATPAGMQRFIGRYLTEPKPQVWFERPAIARCRHFERDAKRNGVQLDRRSRISYRQSELFVNGDVFALTRESAATFRRLADTRQLSALQCREGWPFAGDWLAQWHAAGWVGVSR